MAYRKAKCIELHDVNTVITTSEEQYTLTAAAGRSVQASRPAFLLCWADLALLARRFGINLPGSLARQRSPEDDAVAELPLFRAYYETPANTPGVSILKLECDVLGPNLVEIRMESRLDSALSGEENDVEVITHSGAFTIWWATDRPGEAQQRMAVAEEHPPIAVEGDEGIESIVSTTGLEMDLDIPNGA